MNFKLNDNCLVCLWLVSFTWSNQKDKWLLMLNCRNFCDALIILLLRRLPFLPFSEYYLRPLAWLPMPPQSPTLITFSIKCHRNIIGWNLILRIVWICVFKARLLWLLSSLQIICLLLISLRLFLTLTVCLGIFWVVQWLYHFYCVMLCFDLFYSFPFYKSFLPTL